MLIALFFIFGFVIGFSLAFAFLKKKCNGTLQIYKTDINEDESIFLQLNEQIDAIKSKSFVMFKIVYCNLIDKSHK